MTWIVAVAAEGRVVAPSGIFVCGWSSVSAIGHNVVHAHIVVWCVRCSTVCIGVSTTAVSHGPGSDRAGCIRDRHPTLMRITERSDAVNCYRTVAEPVVMQGKGGECLAPRCVSRNARGDMESQCRSVSESAMIMDHTETGNNVMMAEAIRLGAVCANWICFAVGPRAACRMYTSVFALIQNCAYSVRRRARLDAHCMSR